MFLQSKSIEYIIVIQIAILTILNANQTSVKEDSLVYILSWTKEDTEIALFTCLDHGRDLFVKKHCIFQNCFYTSNKTYFKDVRDFDIILFDVAHYYFHNPIKRSNYQRYVFLSSEPASRTVIPKIYKYKHFFNMTATYKLNSNIPLRNFVVKNNKGKVIGPNTNVQWKNPKKMKPANNYIKSKLRHKKTAAAWMSSHCNRRGESEMFIVNLTKELHKYKLKIDIIGECGKFNCNSDIDNVETCEAIIESDYYFFLVFEDYMDEDYVSTKIMIPMLHYSVPVVYGGANYSRCVLILIKKSCISLIL